jgi:hypothetical protein
MPWRSARGARSRPSHPAVRKRGFPVLAVNATRGELDAEQASPRSCPDGGQAVGADSRGGSGLARSSKRARVLLGPSRARNGRRQRGRYVEPKLARNEAELPAPPSRRHVWAADATSASEPVHHQFGRTREQGGELATHPDNARPSGGTGGRVGEARRGSARDANAGRTNATAHRMRARSGFFFFFAERRKPARGRRTRPHPQPKPSRRGPRAVSDAAASPHHPRRGTDCITTIRRCAGRRARPDRTIAARGTEKDSAAFAAGVLPETTGREDPNNGISLAAPLHCPDTTPIQDQTHADRRPESAPQSIEHATPTRREESTLL